MAVGGELEVIEEVEVTTDIKFCEDGHRCENGSECVESETDEGNFFCDCDTINKDDAFHGLSCEHKATVYCNSGNKFSRASFCTNGGSCKVYVGKNDQHLGCTCESSYEGPHCQFVAGTQPDKWHGSMNSSAGTTDVQISGAAVFLIALICFTVLIGTSVVVWRGLRRRTAGSIDVDTTSEATTQNGELTLSVDGSSIKGAMSPVDVSSATNNKEPEMETIMDDEAEII